MRNFRIAPEGVDLILDCMAGDDCERGLGLLKFNGKYIMYGTSSLLSWDVKNFFGITKGMSNVCQIIFFINEKQKEMTINFSFSHIIVVVAK